MRTPESIADIGAGAEGCASGSHAWNGTSAAFRPKPIMKRTVTSSVMLPPPFWARTMAMSAMFSVEV